MASKFQQFLSDNKIDPRRVLVASDQIEKLRPEDRALRLARRQARKEEGGKKPEGKPRSGRPVTTSLLNNALAGKAVTGPAKTRLLRAVNKILETKKKDPVELKALF